MQFASHGVRLDWVYQLELLDNDSYPLPGGSLQRGPSSPDARLSVQDAKSTDIITIYEHVASMRHKPTQEIYVAFRETPDALYLKNFDAVRYPKWVMEHPLKKAEARIFLMQAKANPKPIMKSKGTSEMWLDQWLADLKETWQFEALAYFIETAGLVSRINK